MWKNSNTVVYINILGKQGCKKKQIFLSAGIIYLKGLVCAYVYHVSVVMYWVIIITLRDNVKYKGGVKPLKLIVRK